MTYLFSWNPDKWPWDALPSLRLKSLKGQSVVDDWSSGNNKSIPSGARFFLIRQGRDPRGIMGSGRTISDWFQQPHWDGTDRLQNSNAIRFDVLLDPEIDNVLPVEELSDLQPSLWRMASSGISLPDEIAVELELRWDRFLRQIGRRAEFPPEPADDLEFQTSEGRQLLARHFVRERHPGIVRLKKQSELREKGCLKCEACKFDFEEIYGSLGEAFCECHHRLPLDNGERETRSIDLAIVCANCHRMLHRTNSGISVEDLAAIVKDRRI